MSVYLPLRQSLAGKLFCEHCDGMRAVLEIIYCDSETLYRCASCNELWDEEEMENLIEEDEGEDEEEEEESWYRDLHLSAFVITGELDDE